MKLSKIIYQMNNIVILPKICCMMICGTLFAIRLVPKYAKYFFSSGLSREDSFWLKT